MSEWLPLINAASILLLLALLWYKLHRLRVELTSGLKRVEEEMPTALVGEAFVGERFAHVEQVIGELSHRMGQIERYLSRTDER